MRTALSALLLLPLIAGCSATVTESVPAGQAASQAPEPARAAEPAASGATPFLADEAAIARGQGLFRAVCTGYCHTVRPSDRVAPFLFDCASSHGGSDEEIFAVVRDGVAETQMQGFGGKLPDDDLWKIVAFIRSRTAC